MCVCAAQVTALLQIPKVEAMLERERVTLVQTAA